MRCKLVLDHEKPWLLSAQIDQVAIWNVPGTCLPADFLLDVEINPLRTKQIALYLDNRSFEVRFTGIASPTKKSTIGPKDGHGRSASKPLTTQAEVYVNKPQISKPSWSFAASDMRLGLHGGSKTIST